MQKLLVVLVIVLAAVTLPAGATDAQTIQEVQCAAGVEVEGHCLSVDDQATRCNGAACLEFVEESVNVCPDGAIEVPDGQFINIMCEQLEAAGQGAPGCPDGARGEVGGCFIYLATGPDGCPSPSVIDGPGNCRRSVADAAGPYFCETDGAMLYGTTCTTLVDQIPSPCPAGTTRFDGACWRLNGLTAPESCAGHGVTGTIELASGRCEVPLAIPTGPATCIDGAKYVEHPSFVLIDPAGDVQGQGPIAAGCIDEATDAASMGISVRTCVFLDDDLDWGDIGDPGLCTRFEQPSIATCPEGFSIDDSLGGLCSRFEASAEGSCPEGGALNGASCVFQSEFSEFACAANTERLEGSSVCVAYRAWQGSVSCNHVAALLTESSDLEFGLPLGCFALVGPQPDSCNGVGTLDACFEIVEPAPVNCQTVAGCISIQDSTIVDVTMCRGRVVTVDLNLTPPQQPTEGDDVILGTPQADTIDGLGGDDFICALGGDDIVSGGPGDDLISGGSGNDTINGDSGDDRLFGVAGDDIMNGGDGADTLHGKRGNHTLDGGADDDRLFGYADDDTLNGGAGDDKIFGHFGNDTLNGDDGNDRLFGWGNDDIINGGSGDDLISGNFGNDTINAGPGNDLVFGSDGDDIITGGTGNDVLNGNSLNDTINGGLGDDTIDGGIGTDSCNGDAGVDTAARCETLIGIP